MPESTSSDLSILRRKAVRAAVGISESAITRRITAGTFPHPIRLSAHSVGWRRADIEAWLRDPAGYRAPEGA